MLFEAPSTRIRFPLKAQVSSILFRFAQPNRKYFCYKYKHKQHNNWWKEPPVIEFIMRIKVTHKHWDKLNISYSISTNRISRNENYNVTVVDKNDVIETDF